MHGTGIEKAVEICAMYAIYNKYPSDCKDAQQNHLLKMPRLLMASVLAQKNP
jgi:hypothetical protein